MRLGYNLSVAVGFIALAGVADLYKASVKQWRLKRCSER